MVTRAICIVVVDALITDACIMVIRKFMARYGRPYIAYGDKGTYFVVLLVISKNAWKNGIKTLCVNDWHLGESSRVSIFMELLILVEFWRDWYEVARKEWPLFWQFGWTNIVCYTLDACDWFSWKSGSSKCLPFSVRTKQGCSSP